MSPSQEDDASHASGNMRQCYGGCISLWVMEMLLLSHTSLTQNWTQKERLLKKYRLGNCSRQLVCVSE